MSFALITSSLAEIPVWQRLHLLMANNLKAKKKQIKRCICCSLNRIPIKWLLKDEARLITSLVSVYYHVKPRVGLRKYIWRRVRNESGDLLRWIKCYWKWYLVINNWLNTKGVFRFEVIIKWRIRDREDTWKTVFKLPPLQFFAAFNYYYFIISVLLSIGSRLNEKN